MAPYDLVLACSTSLITYFPISSQVCPTKPLSIFTLISLEWSLGPALKSNIKILTKKVTLFSLLVYFSLKKKTSCHAIKLLKTTGRWPGDPQIPGKVGSWPGSPQRQNRPVEAQGTTAGKRQQESCCSRTGVHLRISLGTT